MSDLQDLMIEDMDFASYYKETEAAANVMNAYDYLEALKDSIRVRHRENRVYLPWDKVRPYFEFRKGEVTLWAGQNGHGKSQVTDEVKLSLLGQEQKVASASFEMKPVTNLRRMARMYMRENPYSDVYQGSDKALELIDQMFTEFCEWAGGRLWIYNQHGDVDPVKVVGFVRYCAKVLKCDHIFIDNLAKSIRNEDDYNEQKAFMGTMCSIAHDYGCHIHIVHHLKKPAGGESAKPDKYDVKGSGSLTDQPDNIFLVWRNKPKEESMKQGKKEKEQEPDAILFCRKQRNYEGDGDNEPTIALWLHKLSLQFVETQGGSPLYFPNYPHYEN